MHNITCQPLFLTLVCVCVIQSILLVVLLSSPEEPHTTPLRRETTQHYQYVGEPCQLSMSSPIATSVSSSNIDQPSCTPKQRLVFLKTHKTASTTVTSIFQRYGYYRNLTFAVGKSHILSFPSKFHRKHVMSFPGMEGQHFDILANHARYNRPELDAVVPNAIFVTIIRKPEDQIDSAFGYFEMYKGMGLVKDPNPLKSFMDDPMKYYKDQQYFRWQLSRNGMLFDLGFDHDYDEDRPTILEKVLEIAKDIDLVLLAEYFDESLLLMKNLLCWNYEDILYIPHLIRSESHRYERDEALIEKLRAWSTGDALLYNFFNKTFWNKVAIYGPTFGEDLAHFREMNKAVFDECIAAGKLDKRDARVEEYTLENQSERCVSMIRGDPEYTSLIRKSMEERFGVKS